MKKLKTISLRITEEEFDLIKRKADNEDKSISQYLRELSDSEENGEKEEIVKEERFLKKLSKGIEEKITEMQKYKRLTFVHVFAFFGMGYIFGVATVLAIILIIKNMSI